MKIWPSKALLNDIRDICPGDDWGCEIDLSTELDGPIFEPLKDKAYFIQFSVRYNTISWENGADFAPEFLWEKITQQQTPADWQKAASRNFLLSLMMLDADG